MPKPVEGFSRERTIIPKANRKGPITTLSPERMREIERTTAFSLSFTGMV